MYFPAKEKIVRIVLFIFSLFTLILQYDIMLQGTDGFETFISKTITFLSYMTILTNILVALVYIIPLVMPATKTGKFLSKPFVQTATLVYIIVVCIGYHILLSKIWSPQGLQKAADISLHYLVPVFYIFFWLFFVQKGTLKYTFAFTWLLYPAAYLIYAIIRGSITGIYAYYFLDLQKNELQHVITIITALLSAYIIVGLVAIFIYRKILMRLKA